MDSQIKTNLYQEVLEEYRKWFVKRYNTIHYLKLLAQELDKWKFGTNVTKNVSGGMGIAAGVLSIVSMPLPVVLPAALVVGGIAAGTSIVSAGVTHRIEKNVKKSFQEICTDDGDSSKALRESLNKLHQSINLNINTNNEKCDVTDAGTVTGAALATSNTIVTIGQGAIKVVDVAAETVAVAAKLAGPMVAVFGIGIDAATMGATIHDMVENNSKHKLAKKIEEYVVLLEMEMYLRARQIIPVKYLLVNRHLQEAQHDIKL